MSAVHALAIGDEVIVVGSTQRWLEGSRGVIAHLFPDRHDGVHVTVRRSENENRPQIACCFFKGGVRVVPPISVEPKP